MRRSQLREHLRHLGAGNSPLFQHALRAVGLLLGQRDGAAVDLDGLGGVHHLKVCLYDVDRNVVEALLDTQTAALGAPLLLAHVVAQAPALIYGRRGAYAVAAAVGEGAVGYDLAVVVDQLYGALVRDVLARVERECGVACRLGRLELYVAGLGRDTCALYLKVVGAGILQASGQAPRLG